MKVKMYVCKRVGPIGGIDIFFQMFHRKAFLELLAFTQDEEKCILGHPHYG